MSTQAITKVLPVNIKKKSKTKGISKNSSSSRKSKVFKQVKNDSLKFSSIQHRNCSGVDNWKKFLESKGMSLKVQNSNVNNRNRAGNINGHPKTNKNNKITKVVAMDCEMVGIGESGEDNMLARVSIVNNYGDCIYDKYVRPREKVVDYRTPVSGIRPEDIENAEEFEVVQREVADILKTRILVGHALKNDLDVLFLTHPHFAVRDTAKFFCKKNKRTPSLKSLAAEYLNIIIQEGEHSSIQDAQAAMQLYNMYRTYWEAGKGNKSRRRLETCIEKNEAEINTNLEPKEQI